MNCGYLLQDISYNHISPNQLKQGIYMSNVSQPKSNSVTTTNKHEILACNKHLDFLGVKPLACNSWRAKPFRWMGSPLGSCSRIATAIGTPWEEERQWFIRLPRLIGKHRELTRTSTVQGSAEKCAHAQVQRGSEFQLHRLSSRVAIVCFHGIYGQATVLLQDFPRL